MARFFPYLQAGDGQYLREIKRWQREENDPFLLPDIRFVEMFRLNKDVMAHIINVLEPHMPAPSRRHGVSPKLRILAVIRFFACGSYQRCVGQDVFVNLSQAKMSEAISEVSTCIVRHLGHYVSFPEPEEYLDLKHRHMQLFRIPGVVGFVDGTHIAVHNPGTERAHQFYNRKGFFSKNIQIICDSDYRILSLNAAFGGASHDAFVWRASNVGEILRERFQEGDTTSWLLGDSGYPLMPYLITPVRNPADNSPESRFNVAHRRARCTVERCIGILKARFRCLQRERILMYSPEKAGTIINACAILHNVMIRHNLPLPHEDQIQQLIDPDENEEELNDDGVENLDLALQTRARIINNYFN